MTNCGLRQLNKFTNSLGNTLDLILYCNACDIECTPTWEFTSRHHHPLDVNLSTIIEEETALTTMTKINHYSLSKRLNAALAEEYVEVMKNISSNEPFDIYIDNMLTTINQIIQECSRSISTNIPKWQSNHPWLHRSTTYHKKYHVVRRSFSIYRKNKSVENRVKWSTEREKLVNIFDNCRSAHISKAIDHSKGTPKEFFLLSSAKAEKQNCLCRFNCIPADQLSLRIL